jgi:oligoribonuclease NrnB/cAMP/cGMP phosphodiesterase (DHH superfamily)
MFLDKFGKSRIAQDKSDVPLSIKLVNSWDIWNGLYIDAEPYKVYFECQNLTPVDDEVKELLSNDIKVNKAIIEGNIMLKFYHNWGKQYCERYGYPIQYKKNDFFVLNVGNANSKIFGDIINDYDAVIIYCNNGVKYKCSIYSAKDFDCAKFAEQFGGGGHKGAAGFVIDELPVWLRDRKSGLFFKED